MILFSVGRVASMSKPLSSVMGSIAVSFQASIRRRRIVTRQATFSSRPHSQVRCFRSPKATHQATTPGFDKFDPAIAICQLLDSFEAPLRSFPSSTPRNYSMGLELNRRSVRADSRRISCCFECLARVATCLPVLFITSPFFVLRLRSPTPAKRRTKNEFRLSCYHAARASRGPPASFQHSPRRNIACMTRTR